MRLLNFSKLASLISCALAVAIAARTPIFADIGPPIRTGLWVMQRLPRDTNELNQVAAELAKNHNLSGVCLHFFWNDLRKYPESRISVWLTKRLRSSGVSG